MSLSAVAFTLGGLALLAIGGEMLLRGAVVLALRSGLSPLLIGLTVVAFATSAPELLVTVTAGLKGTTDIGVGNVIGSNIANVLLILGAAALIRPIETPSGPVLRDAVAMIVATAVFILFGMAGPLGVAHGLIMLLLITLYIAYSYRQEDQAQRQAGPASGDPARADRSAGDAGDGKPVTHNPGPVSAGLAPALTTGAAAAEAGTGEARAGATHADADPPRNGASLGRAILLLVFGLAGLAVGSELLVNGAASIARSFGISDAVIGLTLVAFGTSLPELATALIAGLRGHSEIALGNVLGSNIFNILLILGCLAIIVPFEVSAALLGFDVWVMAATSLLVIPVMLTGRRVSRLEGIFFLVLYATYIFHQFEPSMAAG